MKLSSPFLKHIFFEPIRQHSTCEQKNILCKIYFKIHNQIFLHDSQHISLDMKPQENRDESRCIFFCMTLKMHFHRYLELSVGTKKYSGNVSMPWVQTTLKVIGKPYFENPKRWFLDFRHPRDPKCVPRDQFFGLFFSHMILS